jgi:hypothetical protein
MAGGGVLSRKEELVGRQQQMSAWPQKCVHLAERTHVIGDMFEHVEHPGGRKAARRPPQILQPPANHGFDASGPSRACPVQPWFEQHTFYASVRQSIRDVAVAATDVEEDAGVREAPRLGYDAAVSMPEPEGFILNQQAIGVSLVGVRYRTSLRSVPDIVHTLYEPGCQNSSFGPNH